MKKILRLIDTISEWTGKIFCWLGVVLIVIMTYEVICRYIFGAPTMWSYETCMMIGGTIFAMGWSYVHFHHGHIRVDVLYERFSPRKKALINVIFTLFFLFPLIAVLINASVSYTVRAWLINEKSVETYWYPPAAPFRTMVTLGICLFSLQSVAEFIRDTYYLAVGKPYD